MAFESMISRVWTALPGVIQAVTNNGNTVEVQPAINGRVRQLDGTYKPIQMPKLVDVPICWQGGGGATWTFPIATGDECLVVFSARCIDSWWQNGFVGPPNVQDSKGNYVGPKGADGKAVNPLNDPPEFRMHNLSDGFAIIGVRSMSRAFDTFDTTTARLRTDDDSCYVEFDPVNKKVNIVAPGGISLNGVTIDTNSNLTSPATITGQTQVVAKTGGSAVHLSTHGHPSNGQPPTPGS